MFLVKLRFEPCAKAFHSLEIVGPGTISIAKNSTPVAIKVSGSQKLQWIWFQGPYTTDKEPATLAEDPDPERKLILWKIAPPDFRFIEMDKAPLIIYGALSAGWEQEIPEGKRPPPPLLEGYVYYVQAVLVRGGLEMCIFIKNGQAHPYREEDDKSICGVR